MSNDFYNNSTSGALTSGVTALAADVESKFDDVAAGFDKLPSESSLIRGKVNFSDDTGSANAYAVTMDKTPTAYVDDMEVIFKVANANTGACTINVDSLGVKSIKRHDGTALESGNLPANCYVHLRYDADNGYFVLLSSATHEKRIADLETSVNAALVAGSGCPVSLQDIGAGVLEDKIIEDDGSITITKQNAGGNESLALKSNLSSLPNPLDTNGKIVKFSKGSDIASAATISIPTDGNYFVVTGTTGISAINTTSRLGTLFFLKFSDALVITHHATSNILPGGLDITTDAGTAACVVEESSGNFRWLFVQKAHGKQVIAPKVEVFTSSGTSTVPSWATFARIPGWGAGAGGGSGGNAGSRNGGTGGGGGEYVEGVFTVASLGGAGATLTVVVGAGGTGGDGVTGTANGNSGTSGGFSAVTDGGSVTYLKALGGAAGSGGTTNTAETGGYGGGLSADRAISGPNSSYAGEGKRWSGAGGGTSSNTPKNGGGSVVGGCGGGCGGSFTSTNGTSGGTQYTDNGSGGTGGSGSAGGNGANGFGSTGGEGGGGGGAHTGAAGTNGYDGGDGGTRGGGGGGGGYTADPTDTSGAGGDGGRGEVIIYYW